MLKTWMVNFKPCKIHVHIECAISLRRSFIRNFILNALVIFFEMYVIIHACSLIRKWPCPLSIFFVIGTILKFNSFNLYSIHYEIYHKKIIFNLMKYISPISICLMTQLTKNIFRLLSFAYVKIVICNMKKCLKIKGEHNVGISKLNACK